MFTMDAHIGLASRTQINMCDAMEWNQVLMYNETFMINNSMCYMYIL
jgi:hypothetical protein